MRFAAPQISRALPLADVATWRAVHAVPRRTAPALNANYDRPVLRRPVAQSAVCPLTGDRPATARTKTTKLDNRVRGTDMPAPNSSARNRAILIPEQVWPHPVLNGNELQEEKSKCLRLMGIAFLLWATDSLWTLMLAGGGTHAILHGLMANCLDLDNVAGPRPEFKRWRLSPRERGVSSMSS
jgi:hypothetical protein